MTNFWNRLSGLSSPIEFNSPLGLPAWFILAGVPVGIIALYFLKLRRRPVRVPSTILWRRSLEDLHVNSLFQRLRRNLLLFLQLLAVALAMLALAGPRMKGSSGQGQRFVLLIDCSASMAATDVAPSRLAKAKQAAKKVVSEMDADDLAMVIKFDDSAQVVSNYTGDRRALLQRIDSIEPSQSTTSLREGLQVAAGLANPSKTDRRGGGRVVGCHPQALHLHRRRLRRRRGLQPGQPRARGHRDRSRRRRRIRLRRPRRPPAPDGKARARNPSDNVAILALQTRRDEDKPEIYQLFGRVHNYRAEEVATEAQLFRHAADKPGDEGTLVDAIALKLAPQSDQSFKFDLPDNGLTPYEVRLTEKDALDVDNRAYTVVGTTRKAQVLAISDGNRYLTDTLKTPSATEHADITILTPEEAKNEAVVRDVKGGRYDLVIYDGVKPDSPPEANALYFGAFPPGPAYAQAKEVQQPVILDWDIAHPMMQYIRDLSLVYVAKASVVELPDRGQELDRRQPGLAGVHRPARRLYRHRRHVSADGRDDAQYDLVSIHQLSALHLEQHSGPGQRARGGRRRGRRARAPGRPARRDRRSNDHRQLGRPASRPRPSLARPREVSSSTRPTRPAIYLARWEPKGLLPFAVNLFDPRESDLAPRGLVPDGTPESMAEVVQDQDRLQPRHRHPEAGEHPERHLVVAGAAGARGLARRVVYL